jgi:hypothetical protein
MPVEATLRIINAVIEPSEVYRPLTAPPLPLSKGPEDISTSAAVPPHSYHTVHVSKMEIAGDPGSDDNSAANTTKTTLRRNSAVISSTTSDADAAQQSQLGRGFQVPIQGHIGPRGSITGSAPSRRSSLAVTATDTESGKERQSHDRPSELIVVSAPTSDEDAV